MQAQSDQKHWVAKLKAEQEKVNNVQEQVNLVEQEFEARSDLLSRLR